MKTKEQIQKKMVRLEISKRKALKEDNDELYKHYCKQIKLLEWVISIG